MKFAFNKKARAEVVKVLRTAGKSGSTFAILLSMFLNTTFSDKVTIIIGSLIAYMVTNFAIIYIVGLEDEKEVKKDFEKPKSTRSKKITKANDTS